MTAKVRSRLWFVVRGSRDGRRKPGLRWIAVERSTQEMMFLVKPYCERKMLRRSDLADWLLFENVLDALNAFQERAEHWKQYALDDMDWAMRDIRFIENAPVIAKLMRYAKEGS